MSEPRATVLLVDDDEAIGQVLTALMSQIGLRSLTARSGDAALALLETHVVDLVVTDLRMGQMDGMTLLRHIVTRWRDIPVIMLTAHGSVQLAVEAMKSGASDFLLKPFDRDEVIFVVEKVLTTSAQARAQPPPTPDLGHRLLGDSLPMRETERLISRAAQSMATVLIQGETGTGKELVARAIHERSPRSHGPFVRLNLAAFPNDLLESELFGYEKGAFTGAIARKPGRVEIADTGTFFLDEIGDVSLSVQVKLLRVIQEKEIERLGGTRTTRVDVRFVAATHRDLKALVANGQFREDLYYRLAVIPIRVPALRDRESDIKLLAQHFTAQAARANGREPGMIEPDALELLTSHPWPGNVRQLENVIERLIVLSDSGVITREQVQNELDREAARPGTPRSTHSANTTPRLPEERRLAERAAIERALSRAGNNRSLAARLLGISRRTLYNKLEELGLG